MHPHEEAKIQRIMFLHGLLHDREMRDKERRERAIYNFRAQVDLQLKSKGLTQIQLAKMLGINRSRLNYILSPRRSKATLDTLNEIASILDCSIDVRLTTFSEQETLPTKPILRFEEEFSPARLAELG